uniref:Uncharacterized protein n=1 Tax=Knipowitschia caucasica TaxID=637954 RepID=A0AAV2MHA1_KNICA
MTRTHPPDSPTLQQTTRKYIHNRATIGSPHPPGNPRAIIAPTAGQLSFHPSASHTSTSPAPPIHRKSSAPPAHPLSPVGTPDRVRAALTLTRSTSFPNGAPSTHSSFSDPAPSANHTSTLAVLPNTISSPLHPIPLPALELHFSSLVTGNNLPNRTESRQASPTRPRVNLLLPLTSSTPPALAPTTHPHQTRPTKPSARRTNTQPTNPPQTNDTHHSQKTNTPPHTHHCRKRHTRHTLPRTPPLAANHPSHSEHPRNPSSKSKASSPPAPSAPRPPSTSAQILPVTISLAPPTTPSPVSPSTHQIPSQPQLQFFSIAHAGPVPPTTSARRAHTSVPRPTYWIVALSSLLSLTLSHSSRLSLSHPSSSHTLSLSLSFSLSLLISSPTQPPPPTPLVRIAASLVHPTFQNLRLPSPTLLTLSPSPPLSLPCSSPPSISIDAISEPNSASPRPSIIPLSRTSTLSLRSSFSTHRPLLLASPPFLTLLYPMTLRLSLPLVTSHHVSSPLPSLSPPTYQSGPSPTITSSLSSSPPSPRDSTPTPLFRRSLLHSRLPLSVSAPHLSLASLSSGLNLSPNHLRPPPPLLQRLLPPHITGSPSLLHPRSPSPPAASTPSRSPLPPSPPLLLHTTSLHRLNPLPSLSSPPLLLGTPPSPRPPPPPSQLIILPPSLLSPPPSRLSSPLPLLPSRLSSTPPSDFPSSHSPSYLSISSPLIFHSSIHSPPLLLP